MSEESGKNGEQDVVGRADESLSMRDVWEEPEQGSIDGKSASCAGPEVFGQVIVPTDHAPNP